MALERANQALGKGDLYRFTIPDPVAEKLMTADTSGLARTPTI